MAARASILLLAFLTSSCSGVRPIQLHPPIDTPPHLVWGYGVEKVKGGDAGRSRQAAYLKAMDDLLSQGGPVLVSKTVEDNTSVLDAKSSSRTMQSTFRLRASRILDPATIETGMEDGFVWVLVGTTPQSIEESWQQFIAWRDQRIAQAQQLFDDARGPEQVARLRSAFALLEEAGAKEELHPLYFEVKAALDTELARIARLEELERDSIRLIASGNLSDAEAALEQASRLGLDPATYSKHHAEIKNRREEAAALVRAGDELHDDGEYRQALETYQRAETLNRDHPQLSAKLATAEREHRTARGQTVRSTLGIVGISAGRALGEYFEYKSEQEKRKRAEAEEERARAEQERVQRERRERNRPRVVVVSPAEPAREPAPAPAPEPTSQPTPVPPPAPVESEGSKPEPAPAEPPVPPAEPEPVPPPF